MTLSLCLAAGSSPLDPKVPVRSRLRSEWTLEEPRSPAQTGRVPRSWIGGWIGWLVADTYWPLGLAGCAAGDELGAPVSAGPLEETCRGAWARVKGNRRRDPDPPSSLTSGVGRVSRTPGGFLPLTLLGSELVARLMRRRGKRV
jgi:hypothetical protein